MSFDIDLVYVIYLLVALAAGLFAEGVYLLLFTTRSYRKNINRRLRLMDNQPDREGMLVQLRRERGLHATGVRPRFLAELAARGIKIPGSTFDPSKPL